MVPSSDDTPESLDGQVTGGSEPDRPVEKSVGEGETAGNDPSTDSGGEAFGEDWTPPGMLADRYRLEDELGRGGMGVVYQARDTRLKRTVAVKLISRGTVARFQTEAEAVAQLNHPNIAHVYEFDQQDDLHYIVMEHVEGESLSQRLAREGTIPPAEAIRITISLCDALVHAHGKGIIHRDIKPSNVLLSDEGVPKLVDFGLARIESDQGHITRAEMALGTIDYMSPEQRRDASGVDQRSDLWSLGATFYEMLTGDPPQPVDLESIPEGLHSTISKTLKRNPEDRYQSAEELRTALSDNETRPPDDERESKSKRQSSRDPSRRSRMYVAQLPLLVLFVFGLLPVNGIVAFLVSQWISLCQMIRWGYTKGWLLGAVPAVVVWGILLPLKAVYYVLPVFLISGPEGNTWWKSFLGGYILVTGSVTRGAKTGLRDCLRCWCDAVLTWAIRPGPELHAGQENDKDEWKTPWNLEEFGGGQRTAVAILGLIVAVAFWASVCAVAQRRTERIASEKSVAEKFAAILEQAPVRNSIGMKLKLIPMGEFSRFFNHSEKPHVVKVTKPFYLGVTEVTQAQYERVMGTNPSHFNKQPQHAVERVSWEEAVEFCRKLSALPAEKAAGHQYRLPTDAEWEYACRAGTTTWYGFGNTAERLDEYGWFLANSEGTTHPVSEKKPNAWGLHDMHGNVFEWCQDWHDDEHLWFGPDPTGPKTGSHRVFRGGSWINPAKYCSSKFSGGAIPMFQGYCQGFRVVRGSLE